MVGWNETTVLPECTVGGVVSVSCIEVSVRAVRLRVFCSEVVGCVVVMLLVSCSEIVGCVAVKYENCSCEVVSRL